MASEDMSAVLQALKAIQDNQSVLSTGLLNVTKRLDQIAPEDQAKSTASKSGSSSGLGLSSSPIPNTPGSPPSLAEKENAAAQAQKSGFTSRIILT